MTPARHAQVKVLFLAALDRPVAARAAFVAEAAAGDPDLVREVVALLTYHADEREVSTDATRDTSSIVVPARSQPAAVVPSAPPAALVVRAARRLEFVAAATLLVGLVLWVALNVLQGEFMAEFESPRQWVPPVAVLCASSVLLALSRSGRLSPVTLTRLGLVYEVVTSGAITAAAYLGAFEGATADQLNLDRVGLSWVAPWLVLFAVLVPVRPREALLGLVPSAAAMPVVYAIEVWTGHAPALAASQFIELFVFPYALVAAAAYMAARLVHALGLEVRAAQELGAYRLEARVGAGGMGEVWRASHRLLARPAAIKIIRPDVLPVDEIARRDVITRFEREARAVASLQSPHTVEVYDFGRTADGALYYVMELLDGVDLDRAVRRFGPFPPARVVRLLQQACASLGEAHDRGMVHRDIKPANLFLCRLGRQFDIVKVLDFGLVKQVTTLAGPHTAENMLAGTPDFMAPELVTDPGSTDGRADLYALGCVAYWLLTGRTVFEEGSHLSTVLAHVQRVPAPPSSHRADVPEALDRLVLACLAKSPAERPESADALSRLLAAVPHAVAWSDDDCRRWWANLSEDRAPIDAPRSTGPHGRRP